MFLSVKFLMDTEVFNIAQVGLWPVISVHVTIPPNDYLICPQVRLPRYNINVPTSLIIFCSSSPSLCPVDSIV